MKGKEKKPYQNTKKNIPLNTLINFIGKECDYKFSIIDEQIDEELMQVAKEKGIDLTGYKHVIETSAIRHGNGEHGVTSDDDIPIEITDFLLIPYIIKNRDAVIISDKLTNSRKLPAIKYRKIIGDEYVYVEEVRTGRKSLAFQTLYRRKIKKPSN